MRDGEFDMIADVIRSYGSVYWSRSADMHEWL